MIARRSSSRASQWATNPSTTAVRTTSWNVSSRRNGMRTRATPASSQARATPLSISSDAGSVSATGSDFSISPTAPTRPLRRALARGSGPG